MMDDKHKKDTGSTQSENLNDDGIEKTNPNNDPFDALIAGVIGATLGGLAIYGIVKAVKNKLSKNDSDQDLAQRLSDGKSYATEGKLSSNYEYADYS